MCKNFYIFDIRNYDRILYDTNEEITTPVTQGK